VQLVKAQVSEDDTSKTSVYVMKSLIHLSSQ